MPILSYSLTGDNSGLIRAIDGGIAAITGLQKAVSGVSFFPGAKDGVGQITSAVEGLNGGLLNISRSAKQTAQDLKEISGVQALDDLSRKLLVAQGNAALFGDSIKNQKSELSAYQSALNRLLDLGFDPLDNDVTRLKVKIDDLTASITACASAAARVPRDFKISGGFQEFAPIPTPLPRDSSGDSAIKQINADFQAGIITAEQYRRELQGISEQQEFLAQQGRRTSDSIQRESESIQQQDGYIQGLKNAIASLNQQKFGAAFDQLPVINSELQQLEIELKQASNIGKVGFDEFGNALKGVNISNVNGQLFALQNNLFGARQISKDLVRTIDAGSLSGFAKAVGLLATDFLFYAQSAQFAQGATVATTVAIGAEGAVASGTALSVGGLGAAFSSLLNPTTAIVLGIAALGAVFVAYENHQKNATKAATEHLKAIREQKAALDDVLTTLSAQAQVQAKAAESTGTEVAKLGELYLALQNQISVGRDYTSQLVDLQNAYPQFFANIDTTTAKTNELAAAYKNAQKAIEALGQVTAANQLSGQANVDIVKNQVAANSLIPQLVQARSELASITKAVASSNQIDLITANQAISASGQKVTALQDQIQKYNEAVALAKGQVAQFNAIAAQNQSAADAGKNSGLINGLQLQLDNLKKIEPFLKTALQVEQNISEQKRIQAQIDALEGKNAVSRTAAANEYLNVIQSINDILGKSLSDVNKSGLNGYAKQVADITSQYAGLNESLTKVNTKIQEQASLFSASNGKRGFSPSQVANATQQVADASGVLGINQTKQLSDSQINEAQRVSDETVRINNEFGIKAAEGRDKDVASIQAKADKEIAIQQKKSETEQQIQARYDLAISQAGTNQKLIDNANTLKDAEIQSNKDAAAAIIQINKDKELALEAINQKYIDRIAELQDNITTINDFAIATQLGSQESATGRIVKEWETRREAANKYFEEIKKISSSFSGSVNIGIAGVGLGSNVADGINGLISKGISGAQATTNANIDKGENAVVTRQIYKSITDGITQAAGSFYQTLTQINQQTDKSFKAIFAELTASLNRSLNGIFVNILQKGLTSALEKAILNGTSVLFNKSGGLTGAGAAITGAGLAGGLISGATSKTSVIGQGLGGALSGAATGAVIGSVVPVVGTVAGAVIGGVVGLLGGIFGANKAQKELQAQQLAQQKAQTELLKASLAYTSAIIGRSTSNGIITNIAVGSTGQLVATVSGKDLQFVLDRNGKTR